MNTSLQVIEKYLDELQWISEHPVAENNVPAIVKDLRNIVLYEIASEHEVGLCVALLLNSEKSLIRFLNQTTNVPGVKSKEMNKARQEVLLLIGDLIKLRDRRIVDYALSIKELVISVLRREVSNQVKAACFVPLTRLLLLRLHTLDATTLGVNEMLDIFLKEFVFVKSSQSVRSAILRCVGLISELYPHHVADKSKQLLALFVDTLNKQIKSKKPDFTLLTGAIRGLSSFLVHFHTELMSDIKAVESVYKVVCLGCLNPPPGLRTYALPKAALSFLTQHATLFKQYLTEHSEKIYKYLVNFCTHKNRSLRSCAFAALDEFLLQVANEIVSEQRSAQSNLDTFRFFLKEFWNGIESRASGMFEISIAMRGFGVFAKATRLFLGVEHVKKMAHTLLSFQRRYFSQTSLSHVEDSATHLPSFINSLANIVMELEDVDDTILDHLAASIGTFFFVYPHLHASKRHAHYKAISRLFIALYPKGVALQRLLQRIVFEGLIVTCSKATTTTQRDVLYKPPTKCSSRWKNLNADVSSETEREVLESDIREDEEENESEEEEEELNKFVSSRLHSDGIPTENYIEYQDLWRHILNPVVPSDLESFFTLTQRDGLLLILYNELMSSILRILHKLDLRYTTLRDTNDKTNLDADTNKQQHPQSLSETQKQSVIREMKNVLSETRTSLREMSSEKEEQNVTRKKNPSETNDNDNVEGNSALLCPLVTKDFELFLNLVSFCKLLLPKLHIHLFERWLYIFVREVIVKAHQYPLVSGFYKLLSMALHIADRLHYFDFLDTSNNLDFEMEVESVIDSAPNTNTNINININTNTNTNASIRSVTTNRRSGILNEHNAIDIQTRNVCFVLVTKFLKEVETHMKQYKDELLGACLSLVLGVPAPFVNVSQKIPSLQLCLKMGESYWPLALVALDALEYWLRVKPDDTRRHLPLILPSFDPYLRISTSSCGSSDVHHSSSSPPQVSFPPSDKLNRRSGSGGGGGGGVSVKEEESVGSLTSLEADPQSALLAADPERIGQHHNLKREVQMRIVRLLARLGGENVHLIHEVNLLHTTNSDISIAWDTTKRVKFTLPFLTTKPEIYFDDMLPRIAELAENATDRQTKVAACELLHSLLLYMIGLNAKLEPRPLHRLYAHLFPVLLRLAVDVEQVARQLFEPLTTQIIHWFTRNHNEENAETMTLLEAIIDAVGNPTDGALREFAAKCLAEFLKWSIKQSTKKQQEENPFNAKSLFKRVYSLLRHPNPYKRLGSLLSVKILSRVLREEETLVDQFILEICHVLVVSLRLTENDDALLGTERLAMSCIDTLGRVMADAHYATILNRSNPKRRMHADLTHFVEWCFRQLARSERSVRRACMNLFVRLHHKLNPNIHTPREWFCHYYLVHNKCSLRNVVHFFESDTPSSTLTLLPQVSDTESMQIESQTATTTTTTTTGPSSSTLRVPDWSRYSVAAVSHWLRRVHAILDVYVWFLRLDMIHPHDLFDEAEGQSDLLTHLRLFVHHFVRFSDTQKENEIFRTLTPFELDSFHTLQSTLLLRLFLFVSLLLERFDYSSELSRVLDEKFFSSLFESILRPEEFGFGNNKPRELSKFREHTLQLCRLLTPTLTEQQHKLMTQTLRSLLTQDSFNLLRIDLRHGSMPTEHVQSLVQGYLLLHAAQLLLAHFPHSLNILFQAHKRNITTSHQNVTFTTDVELLLFAEYLLNEIFEHSPLYSPLELIVGSSLLQLALTMISQWFTTTSSTHDKHDQPQQHQRNISLTPSHVLFKFLRDETIVVESSTSSSSTPSSSSSSSSSSSLLSHSTTNDTRSAPLLIKKTTKSEMFYRNFSHQFDEHIISHINHYAEELTSHLPRHSLMFRMILSMLDRLLVPSNQKKFDSKVFLQSILRPLSQRLRGWLCLDSSQEEKEKVVELIRKLLQVNASYVMNSPEGVNLVSECFLTFMHRSLPLTFKTECLDLLTPLFSLSTLLCPPPSSSSAITTTLTAVRDRVRDLIVYDFPVSSTDLPLNSALYNVYITAVDKLLRSVAATGSLMLLEEIYPLLREPKHRHAAHIEAQLKAFVRTILNHDTRYQQQQQQQQQQHPATSSSISSSFSPNLMCVAQCMKVLEDNTVSEWLHYGLTRYVLLPLYAALPLHQQIHVTRNYIRTWVRMIDVSQQDISTTRMLSVADIVDRICALQLLDAVYQCLPANIIREQVNTAFCEERVERKGNELTTTVMRATHTIKSEVVSKKKYKDDVSSALLFEYHCTAYNTLATVILCTQTKETFFTVFCFKENPSKNELLWENIVDLTRCYVFEVETNFPVASQQVSHLLYALSRDNSSPTTTTSNNNNNNNDNNNDNDNTSTDTTMRKMTDLRYVASQYLADSSLSQEVGPSSFFTPQNNNELKQETTSDFKVTSSSLEAESNKEKKEKKRERSEGERENVCAVSTHPNEKLELELDPINSNPCMVTILRLIDHMHKQFGNSWSTTEMPKWMKEIHSKCVNATTHINIKLFLVKLVINRPEIFAPYASAWFRPLVQTILSHTNTPKSTPVSAVGAENTTDQTKTTKKTISSTSANISDVEMKDDGDGDDDEREELSSSSSTPTAASTSSSFVTNGFHYFTRDVCIVLLKWSTFVPQTPEDQQLAVQFIEFLMRHCVYPNSQILLNNLQIIKLLIERWRDVLSSLHKKVIVDYLSYDKKPRAVVWCRLTGLQLLGILLANGYVLYDKLRDSSYISESVWYEKILHNLLGSKKVYCMCAEVVGLALEMHKKRESGECPLEQLLRDRIALMFTKEDHIRALDCLNIVAKYYPAFVDSFFLRIFDQLKRFSSDAKVSALSLILQRVDEIEDAFKKLQPRLNELLIHRDDKMQHLVLRILYKLLPRLDETQIATFLDMLIHSCSRHAAVACREVYFDIAMWVYKEKSSLRSHAELRWSLLRGLSDEVESLRQRLLDFWDRHAQLVEVPLDRAVLLLSDLYHPQLESVWLSYATSLLLQLTSRSVDYTHQLFEGSLTDCEFREVHIDSSWQPSVQGPMTPLFSMSTPSQSQLTTTTSLPLGDSTGANFTIENEAGEAEDKMEEEEDDGDDNDNDNKEKDGKRMLLRATQAPLFATQSSLPFTSAATALLSSEFNNAIIDPLIATTSSSPSTAVTRLRTSTALHTMQTDPSPDTTPFSTVVIPTSRHLVSSSKTTTKSSVSSMKTLNSPRQRSVPSSTRGGVRHSEENSHMSLMSIEEGEEEGARLIRLQRRFVKLPQNTFTANPYSPKSSYFMSLALKRAKARLALERQRARDRLHRVTLFRTYRVGELPDISALRPKDLLLPLQALCQRDQSLARLVWIQLLHVLVAGNSQEETNTLSGIEKISASASASASASTSSSSLSSLTTSRQQLVNLMQLVLTRTSCESTAFINALLRFIFVADDNVSTTQQLASTFELLSHLPSSLLGSISLKSLNYHMGILLLEKQLLSQMFKTSKNESRDSSSLSSSLVGGNVFGYYHSKREEGEDEETKQQRWKKEKTTTTKKKEEEEMEEAWMQLAQLYRALGDDDVLFGLYEKAIICQPQTRQALEAELQGDYSEARRLYTEVLQLLQKVGPHSDVWRQPTRQTHSSLSSREIELWEASLLECYCRLTEWETLAQTILDHVNGDIEKLWSDPCSREPFIRYFVQSHLKLREKWTELMNFVTRALQNDERRAYLERFYTSQLAYLYITQDDTARARYYIQRSYELFLQNWTTLPELQTAGRHLLLQELQRLCELEEFVDVVDDEHNFSSPRPLQRLLAEWRRRYPSHQHDNVNVWEDVITQRATLLVKLHERFVSFWQNKIDPETRQDEKPLRHSQSGSSNATTTPPNPHQHFQQFERCGSSRWSSASTYNRLTLQPLSRSELNEFKHQLMNERAELFRRMSVAARKQHNFTVADKFLRLSLKAKDNKKEFDFDFFHALVKLHCLKAHHTKHEVDAIDKFTKALKFLQDKQNEPIITTNINIKIKFLMLRGRVCEALYRYALQYPYQVVDCFNTNQITQILCQSPTEKVIDASNIASALRTFTLHTYDGLIQLHKQQQQQQHSDSSSKVTSAAKAYMSVALFCDELLRENENISSIEVLQEPTLKTGTRSGGVLLSSQTQQQLKERVITLVLEAMRLGSSTARDRFPRLLQLLRSDDADQHSRSTTNGRNDPEKEGTPESRALGTLFVNLARTNPRWMYLRWISQMMALLNKPEARYVLPLLIELAKRYPQALYYPFKISSETLNPTSADIQQLVTQLRTLLTTNPLLDMWVHQLERLTHPEHRWKDWTDTLKHLMSQEPRNVPAIQRVWIQMWNDCLDAKQPYLGTYNKQFALTYGKLVENLFGKDGSKLVTLDLPSFNKILTDLNEKMRKNLSGNQTVKQKLTEFSLWLARFEQSDYSADWYIELPGQYKGTSEPQPNHHVRISSFDETLLVMGSMRKPKRLKIRGNDERDYFYLVKGGEDLRLDQRVQQLFQTMNQFLQEDPTTSRRKFSIHTYQVIPMTSKLGIIEWLQDTKPLKAIIEDEIARRVGTHQETSILKISAAKIHDEWVRSFAKFISNKNVGVSDMYYTMFKHASRNEVQNKVKSQLSTIPWDILRCGIQCLAHSPEAFLQIRNTFARSLAVFSIASYIIGIGDRHLDNFLLNLHNGEVIGIDFGHAFGTATQFLPIPELVPFRLTQQFVNFLLPLGSEGLLKQSMIHTLNALRAGKQVLLNVMDVFVQEPLLDWQKLARGVATIQRGVEKSDDETHLWFPKKKIDIAKRKLELVNPAFITLTELNESIHCNKSYMPALKDIVLGDPKVNFRATLKEKCLTTKQQVECLLDQATDPNILGRAWGGWAAWI